ncbi:P-loop containing nucleoside triphosphate hydrolases superfamily protein [Actinidia rufa]|uniref:P-loop containing nucleoside triphosphate hydrolases superfamily protein n=1 Tax=Actinidia rufa TaxID=165716 RepID=A0A7J0HCX3_9ERIC|nr:P-loop containing nucleoside triphosphate hydrolases superfamily protein [Actinidia rufa]
MKAAVDTRKSICSLAESIHSLLGLKTRLTSSWVDSVCNIIKSSPSQISLDDHNTRNGNKEVDMDLSILKIKDELAALAANIYKLNIERRQVLNDFLDLKGNIRVFCRVRPITVGDNFNRPRPVVALGSTSLQLKFAENKSKFYSFDKVFALGSSQDEIFLEVEPVIKSALDGYNACIFAYGQTGTGKTFTMEGTADDPGVIPRVIEALFKQAADINHTFLFSFSMLEIYMGYLKDLLVPQTRKATDVMPPCLSIQTDSKGEIEIDNLVTIQVSDFNQAIRLYRLGCRFRSKASTNSNKSSSRSHCMIRISMTCFDANERPRITNKIWMVDLGGSERVLKTKAWGRRFEEGKAINLSLSALGDVINALQRKNCHIPYRFLGFPQNVKPTLNKVSTFHRNSKLTQVLKDSLGEDSKTLMLVHVSPKEDDLCETQANAQREFEMTSLQQRMKWIEDKRHEVRSEIQKLNEKLEDLTGTSPSSSKQLEASHLSFELEVSQSNIEIDKDIGNVKASRTAEFPGFMRPTICSRRKSGVDHQASEERDPVPASKRRTSSHRAESVTLPIKGISGNSSESGISRTSCLMGSKFKCNSDNETEGSQDKSECDIKTVVFPFEEKLLRSSNLEKAQVSCSERHENRKTHILNSPKFIKVDDWLHLNKQYSSNSRIHQNKQVLAIPHPEKDKRDYRQRGVEQLRDEKVNENKLPKKKINHDQPKKLAEVGAAGRSKSEQVANFMPTVFKGFSNEESRSNYISSTHANDGIRITEAQGMVNDLSTEEYVCSTSTPPDKWSWVLNKKRDESGENGMPMQLIANETKFSEALVLSNSWTSIHSASDVRGPITALMDDFGVSCPKSVLKLPCQKVPTEIGKNSEEEKMHVSSQLSETSKMQHRSLLVERANKVDLAMPTFQLQGKRKSTGICNLLKQKLQTFCNCALIGLGFQSLGLEHDFFYALML